MALALVVLVLEYLVDVVVKALDPRIVKFVLRGTPQVGVESLESEKAIEVPVTGGENREPVVIATVVTTIPASGGSELFTDRGGSTDVGVQGTVLLVSRYMPAFRANTAVGAIWGTGHAIAALGSSVLTELGRAIHHGAPGIKATVLGATVGGIVVAPTGGVTTGIGAEFIRHASVGVVQILCHPGLGAYGDCLIDLAVTVISQCPRYNSCRINNRHATAGSDATARFHTATGRN